MKANIDKADIKELKSLFNPSNTAQIIMEAVYVLLMEKVPIKHSKLIVSFMIY